MVLLRNRSQRLSSHSAGTLSSVKLQCARYWRNGQSLNSCSWWDVTLCWSKILIKQKGKGGCVTSEYLGRIKNETVAVKPLRSNGKCCCSLGTLGRKSFWDFWSHWQRPPSQCWRLLEHIMNKENPQQDRPVLQTHRTIKYKINDWQWAEQRGKSALICLCKCSTSLLCTCTVGKLSKPTLGFLLSTLVLPRYANLTFPLVYSVHFPSP